MARKQAVAVAEPKTAEIIPEEHRGYLLRTSNADGTAFNGFKWPASGYVEAPDWKPEPLCGNGLHGLLNAIGGAGYLKIGQEDALWQVVLCDTRLAVEIGGDKHKVPWGLVVYSGNREGAIEYIRTTGCMDESRACFGFVSDAGYSGQAAASGYSGQAAASGYSGQAAASGYSGQAAASGYSGQAAASGDSGQAAASGYSGQAAASGYSGQAAASGYSGQAAASGDRGQAAASGDRGQAAASGDSGQAAASGDSGQAAASGYRGQAAASGDRGQAAASGYSGQAAASGYSGQAAASGDSGQAAASGDSGQAAASGDSGQAAASGENGIALATGAWGRAAAGKGGIVVVGYDDENGKRRVVVGYVGEEGIQPYRWYRARNGKLVDDGPLDDSLQGERLYDKIKAMLSPLESIK